MLVYSRPATGRERAEAGARRRGQTWRARPPRLGVWSGGRIAWTAVPAALMISGEAVARMARKSPFCIQ